MKAKILCMILTMVLCSISISAQKDIKIDYSDFSTVESANEEDVKTLKEADKIYFKQGNTYDEALPLYLQLLNKPIAYDAVSWRAAMCFLHSENKKHKAKTYLLDCDSTIHPLYYYYLGKAYQFSSEFELAKSSYQLFFTDTAYQDSAAFYKTLEINKRKVSFAKIGDKLIEACDIALSSIDPTLRYSFEALTNINTVDDEMFPVVSPSGSLLYTKAELTHKNKITKIYETLYDNTKKSWHSYPSRRFPEDKGSQIPLANSEYSSELMYNSLLTEKGDIMFARQRGTNLHAKSAGTINSSATEGTACLVSKADIVFSSNRDQDEESGNNDLYIASKNKKGKWGKPIKVTAKINTTGRKEVLSYYNGELYYISNGEGSIGGFDIFKATFLGDNTWGDPQNLGYPINTAENDYGYSPRDSTSAFYSGVRPGGAGGADIYLLTISQAIDTTTAPVIDTISVDTTTVLPIADSISTPTDSVEYFESNLEEIIDSLSSATDSTINTIVLDTVSTTLPIVDTLLVENTSIDPAVVDTIIKAEAIEPRDSTTEITY